MKYLGNIFYYLGIIITWDHKNRIIQINQTNFSKQLVKQLDLIACNTTTIPMDSGNDLCATPDNYTANKEDAAGY